MPEYQSCNCAVEHTVAKKLQALIVREAMAAVGQRLAQQCRLVEDVANFLAKCFRCPYSDKLTGILESKVPNNLICQLIC